MKLGEAIVRKLKLSGIDTAFGIPGGGSSSDLLCNMDEQGMKFVLTQNETTAAIMAGVVGEVTGIPGLCVNDLGPGALQMSTGLAYALYDRAPVLALTDRYGTQMIDYVLRQKVSHTAAFSPITKLTSCLSEQNWSEMLNRGFKEATTPNYGPVHFDVPNDIIKKDVPDDFVHATTFNSRLTADENTVKMASERIKNAKFPVIIVGLGINIGNGQQYEQLKGFVHTFQIPVFKTAKAKGSFPDDDALSLGLFMGGKLERNVMDKCDLIIAVGLDPIELLPKKWAYPQPIVSVTAVSYSDQMYQAEVEVIGDIEFSLGLLQSRMTDCGNLWSAEEVAAHSEYVFNTLKTDVDGLTANEVVLTTQEVLPDDVLMTTDVGASNLIVSQLWKVNHPQSFFMSNGLATMGFSLPAAMALQHVFPHKMVASLTGDGGFMMRLQEIGTAVKHRWPVISIVFSDRSLSLIDVKQITKGYGRTYGNDFVAPDYVKFAEAMGANGWSVQTREELKTALEQAVQMKNGMPSIIEARINPQAYYAQFNAIRDL